MAAANCPALLLSQGLDIPKAVRAPEISGLLEALMSKLEKDRAVVAVRWGGGACSLVGGGGSGG